VARQYVAPRTALEAELAQIWAQVLKLDRVGIEDNFFELGGHSLLATRVVAQIRDELRLDVPLRMLFEQPSIRELARAIDAAGPSTLAPIKTGAVLASELREQVDRMTDDEVLRVLEELQRARSDVENQVRIPE